MFTIASQSKNKSQKCKSNEEANSEERGHLVDRADGRWAREDAGM